MRQKTCKACGKRYQPHPAAPSFANWCSTECGVVLSRAKQDRLRQRQQLKAEKRHRAETRARREALKTKSDWRREAQVAFNTYIRTRDEGRPCISCGTFTPADGYRGGYWDCGHYRSTGAASHLRFNVFNAARQCKKCNQQLSGNVVEYRKGLVGRIGVDRVESLEDDNRPVKYSIEYYKRVKRIFSRRARHIKKLRERRSAA